MKELLSLNPLFARYKWMLIGGIIVTVVANTFSVLVPNFIGEALNVIKDLNNNANQVEVLTGKLWIIIGYIIGAALLSAGFTFLMRQTIIVISRNLEFDLKNIIYDQYQALSLNFYKKNRTGDLMNRISEDVSKVRMYMGPAVMYSVRTLILFMVTIPFMFYLSPSLAVYTLIPLPILSVLIYKLSKAIHKRSTVVQQYLSHLSTHAQESFSGVTVIKAYNMTGPTMQEFGQLSEDSKEKNLNLVKIQALFFPLMILLIGISNLIVIYIGGKQCINGAIEIGTLATFILYVNMLTWPVASVGWITNMVQQAEASMKRINEFLKEEPEIKNLQNNHTPISGNIAFNNVSFTYDDTNITAIKNVSFEINKGETLAIIGKTGSGKSTILELIGRLYDIESGNLLVDNTAINQLHLKDLRSSIGYVPQDAFLFSESIKENIKFGKEDATDEEVQQAAKDAAVHDNIIGFSKGYDTILGERGITLSGGQKQRVSIARAIIKKPKVLLFDDCLSAVDTETEEEILNNLKKVSSGITTIIVSHRISSAKNANKIIVLDDGKIIQEGTHNELVNKQGYYQDLYQKQLAEKTN